MGFLVALAGASIVLIIVSALVETLTTLMVLHGSKAGGKKKRAWSELLEAAKPGVLPLIWTGLVYGLAVFGAFLAAAAIVVAAAVLNPLLGAGVGVLLGLAGFVAFAYMGLRLYTLSAVVAFDGLSGWPAIMKAYAVGKGNVFNALAVVVVSALIGLGVSLLEVGLDLIPWAGGVLSWAVNVAFITFTISLAAAFYFEAK